MRLVKYFIFIVDKKFIIRKMHLVVKYNTSNAGIAQLVEHDLAKVGVASSSLVSRSIFKSYGVLAKRLCTGLQIHVDRFDSGTRLHFLNSLSIIKVQNYIRSIMI